METLTQAVSLGTTVVAMVTSVVVVYDRLQWSRAQRWIRAQRRGSLAAAPGEPSLTMRLEQSLDGGLTVLVALLLGGLAAVVGIELLERGIIALHDPTRPVVIDLRTLALQLGLLVALSTRYAGRPGRSLVLLLGAFLATFLAFGVSVFRLHAG